MTYGDNIHLKKLYFSSSIQMVNIAAFNMLGNMLFLSALVLINSFFECVYIISEIAP